MTMTLPVATARLSREIGDAHTKIDDALVSIAALFASTTQARADLDIEPSIGHRALLRMHKSAGNLLNIRADLIRAHSALLDDLRIVSGAEEPTCPKVEEFFTTGLAAA